MMTSLKFPSCCLFSQSPPSTVSLHVPADLWPRGAGDSRPNNIILSYCVQCTQNGRSRAERRSRLRRVKRSIRFNSSLLNKNLITLMSIGSRFYLGPRALSPIARNCARPLRAIKRIRSVLRSSGPPFGRAGTSSHAHVTHSPLTDCHLRSSIVQLIITASAVMKSVSAAALGAEYEIQSARGAS